MLKISVHIAAAAALLSAAACQPRTRPSDSAGDMSGRPHQVISASNDFAFRLYERLAAEGGNVFFSPYSITVAMAMTLEGARGGTAGEMRRTLGLTGGSEERREFFSRDMDRLRDRLGIEMANSFWAQNGHKFLSRYERVLKKDYHAEAFGADFAAAPEKARLEINAWTSKNTHGKVPDLFPKDSLTNLTRLVLVNAVYFKGEWAAAFDKSMTEDADFFVPSGDTVKVKMMRISGERARFDYAETDGLQILELPYKNDGLSMLLLLPSRDGLQELEKGLSAERLGAWKEALYKERVNVSLPRFTLNARYSLPPVLSEMGMPSAFSMQADFSGMDGTKDLYIQKAVHQGFVEVNEEGTEAAAATGVAMSLKSMPMPAAEFRADRPFLFLIQERGTGRIVFMGRVETP